MFGAGGEGRQQRRSLFRRPRLGLFSREVEGVRVEGCRLDLPSRTHFAEHPIDLLRLFEVSHRTGLDIHPDALQLVTRNLRRINRALRADPEANRIFMRILASETDPEVTLRRMKDRKSTRLNSSH